MSLILKEHDMSVRVLRSDNLGNFYYEDHFHVVSEDWKTLKAKI